MKPRISVLLSLNGGFVDTAGFLALQGLFPAHVTGNFVTLGAALVHGTSGILAKLLALPLFCVVVVVTRLASHRLSSRTPKALSIFLAVQMALLSAGAALALSLGPFTNGDSWQALVTGLTLVSAMAIQTAAHRIYLGSTPPTTFLTGTVTQIMIDAADLLRGDDPQARQTAKVRLGKIASSAGAFAAGCASAALIYDKAGVWCFLVPPVIGLAALVTPPRADEAKTL